MRMSPGVCELRLGRDERCARTCVGAYSPTKFAGCWGMQNFSWSGRVAEVILIAAESKQRMIK